MAKMPDLQKSRDTRQIAIDKEILAPAFHRANVVVAQNCPLAALQ